ncbi:AAA domain-containing protein [Candidatus Poriferisodalis sp.]|uniref:AAA domain-containing protein n=1 Tax=Candidatus Poriferisodalis sp. TaxID=3101277 RepID=UPI003B523BC1
MNLVSGSEMSIVGIVKNRDVVRPRSGGQPFVKATVTPEDGGDVPVVWWDEGRAPANGARVKVEGRVREYNGASELHASNWVVERTGPPEDPVAQVVGFYIGCVEAEAAGSVRVRPGSTGHVELTVGSSPIHGRSQLPADSRVDRWCQQREMALGESIIAGWPMVIGEDSDGGGAGLVASPLLTSDVRLTRVAGAWVVEPDGGGIDLNPYALDLLGVNRNERDALARLVEENPAVEEARLPEDRTAAILSVLADGGVEGLAHLAPVELAPHNSLTGVHSTGMLIVASGSTQITRMLLEDLEQMLNNPKLLSSGPAAVLLGRVPAPASSLPKPHPTVVPSSLVQDQAVASAMENVLTVVTGPPGTGKSQVLVNTIAAAVARKETVLFASKNNQAVDVVFERLKLTSPDPCIVRAGASSLRREVASSITSILGTPRRTVDPVGARRAWVSVEKRIRSIHEVLEQRALLEQEIHRLETVLEGRLDGHPEWVDVDVDPAHLAEAVVKARTSLDALSGRLGLFGRWRKHQERLDRARQALSALGALIGLDPIAVEMPLESVVARPQRSLQPRHDFMAIEGFADGIRWVNDTRATISQTQGQLGALPPKQELDDQLYALSPERTAAGRALLDARWEQVRRDDPRARTAAGDLAEHLVKAANSGSGVRRARGLISSALPAIPVWGVTNLSARTNLPLTSGLFDLVVIDEASQCDVASALPLLARARRALIIGDRRQLIHITSLSGARERTVGRRWALTEDRIGEFSYRSRSCFGLASHRLDESPLFLDLHFRSHPAIIGFSNERFYDGQLEFCSENRPPSDLPAIEWSRVAGDSRKGPQNRSRINPQEAQALANTLVRDAPALSGLGLSLGVVTPYAAQAELIRQHIHGALGSELARTVTVATAHRYQGDERDVIYFSPVIGPSMTDRQAAFAADPNLVNVALTRARRRLVIVGNMDACLRHRNVLSDLASYVSRLEAGAFDSPLELALHEALLEHGLSAETGVIVAGHRLDLAVVQGDHRLDIECDGAAFHIDRDRDAARDRVIEAQGWKVMRFSGRRLGTDLNGCVDEVLAALP